MTASFRSPSLIALLLVLVLLAAAPASSQTPARGHDAESHNMELVGHDDLQGYQPTIHQQRRRWIAYVGHHGGRAANPLTGADEDNGTSIVDVTDPSQVQTHGVEHDQLRSARNRARSRSSRASCGVTQRDEHR